MVAEAPAYRIRTANVPLMVLHITTPDLAQFKAQLLKKLAQAPDFFSHTPVALGLGGIASVEDPLDFQDITTFMRSHGMFAVGVIGGAFAQREAAARAGLGVLPETPARTPHAAEPEAPATVTSAPQQDELPGLEAPTGTPEANMLPPVGGALRPTLLVEKPVRTGQRIYAEGANLVVTAIVNAGAELIADGDIHVYAPLRGRALAGANGNTLARIYVQGMEAELVSIAGYFQVFEEGVPASVRTKPAQVFLRDERLELQPLRV